MGANGLKVSIIDNAADQRLGISTVAFGTGSNLKVNVGTAVTTSITGTIPGSGTTSNFDGYLKGIVTGVTTDSTGNNSSIDVKVTVEFQRLVQSIQSIMPRTTPLETFLNPVTL